MMMSMAVGTLGLPLWLADLGIGPERIGLINALPLVSVVFLSIFVGRLADRAEDWRGVIIVCSAIATAAPLALYFVRDYSAIALVWTLALLPVLAMIPVVDAATIRMATRVGVPYGSIRVWGTIGYIAAALLAGWVMQGHREALFVPLLLAISAVRLAASLFLPALRAPEHGSSNPSPPRASLANETKALLQPWFLLPVVAGALLNASHSALNGFGPLLWRNEGLSEGRIGVYLAIGPISEIAAMLLAGRIIARFEPRLVLTVCCGIGALRWIGMTAPPYPALVVALQSMHMATFGLGYVALVVFADAAADRRTAAQAQSFVGTARNIASILAFALFGLLAGKFGAGVYYAAAATSGLGAILCGGSLMLHPEARGSA
jgi:PPP family 3-phenylpropionic acid transporter